MFAADVGRSPWTLTPKKFEKAKALMLPKIDQPIDFWRE